MGCRTRHGASPAQRGPFATRRNSRHGHHAAPVAADFSCGHGSSASRATRTTIARRIPTTVAAHDALILSGVNQPPPLAFKCGDSAKPFRCFPSCALSVIQSTAPGWPLQPAHEVCATLMVLKKCRGHESVSAWLVSADHRSRLTPSSTGRCCQPASCTGLLHPKGRL